MRRALQIGLVFATAAACSGDAYFVCNGDTDCMAEAGDGICQPTGSCSFPDDDCASGQRYGSQSPPSLAGECVQGGGSTSGVAQSTGTTGGVGSSGTGATGGSTTSSSSGGDSESGTSTTASSCPEDWWDCAYATRHRLSLARPVGESLTNVPILVTLDPDRVDYAGMQNDGEDVRFISAGGLPLPFEFVAWEPGAASTAWVTLDTLGASEDHFWLYYGNPVAQTPQDVGPLWPAPLVGVWRMDGDHADATDNGNDASPAGTLAFEPGQVASAQDFLSNDAKLNTEATESMADIFSTGGTVSAWVFIRGWGGSDFGRIADKYGGSSGWRFYLGADGRLRFGVLWAEMQGFTWTTPTEVLELDTWTHVAAVYDASLEAPAQLYVNGVEAPQDPPPTPPTEPPESDVGRAMTIGNTPGNTRQFDGLIDELRIAREPRSAEWIAVEYDAMRDALLTYGPAEPAGP